MCLYSIQRVALIRTLAIKPNLLLLDEPFSALDSGTRLIIGEDVYNIIRKEKITTILVTHSIEEAITFADKVVVLSKRPSTIKRIINIDISDKSSLKNRRKHSKYNEYFDMIWKDLDINE